MESDSSILLILPELLTVLVLMVIYDFFCLSWVALTNSREHKLDDLVEGEQLGSTRAKYLVENQPLYLFAAQVGLSFTAFIMGIVVVGILMEVDVPLSTTMLTLALALIVCGFLIHLSKAIVFTFPERSLCYLSYPLWLFGSALKPFELPLNYCVKLVSRLTGVQLTLDQSGALSTEDLSEIVERSGEAGTIETDEQELLQGAIEFSDTIVREVMTPRADIIYVAQSAKLEDAVQVFAESGLSRLLVIGEALDDVRGIVMAKDFIPLVGKELNGATVEQYTRDVLSVSQNEKIDDVLSSFQKGATHFAVVLDEHGGVDGVVTAEDLLEEIVGEIYDEHDSPEDEVDIQETRHGDLIVDAGTLIDELNESYDLGLPNGEYDTIAGFVIHELGRLPDDGEKVSYEGIEIVVKGVEHNRIQSVQFVAGTF